MRTIFKTVTIIALLALTLTLLTQMKARTPADEKVVTIKLKAIAGLQYDQVRFAVKPGAKVKVVLANEDDMSHNLVFTKPGTRAAVVDAALKLEEKGPAMNYIPESPDVLWSIAVLAPGEEGTITFTAPDTPGVYPYVCTFPGHGFYMYGAMYVTTEEALPPLEKDANVPPTRQKDNSGHASHEDTKAADHPYPLTPPYLYRAYMAESGPASIAVHLPRKLSYCWDTDLCALRYAWEGDFVDNTGLWKGKPNAVAKVVGNIFYRSKAGQQIQLQDRSATSAPRFKGYRLIDRYPEFHYTIDGLDVYEMIHAKDDGSGLIRTFRIPNANKAIWFVAGPDEGVAYEPSVGQMKNNKIAITPEQARNFSIVMSKTAK